MTAFIQVLSEQLDRQQLELKVYSYDAKLWKSLISSSCVGVDFSPHELRLDLQLEI